jgi:hypothetical protein
MLGGFLYFAPISELLGQTPPSAIGYVVARSGDSERFRYGC